MISTGIKRSLRLTAALGVACFALSSVACNNPADEEDGATPPATENGTPQTPVSDDEGARGENPAPATEDRGAMATVLAFQEAVLALEFEMARTMVDETSGAYANLTAGMTTLETLARPGMPEEARELTIPQLTAAWRGATAELVLEEGNSAIVSVTRSNGESSDVNLNLFEGVWLINSPDDLIRLQ
jgi:hypothetical protein